MLRSLTTLYRCTRTRRPLDVLDVLAAPETCTEDRCCDGRGPAGPECRNRSAGGCKIVPHAAHPGVTLSGAPVFAMHDWLVP